MIGQFCVENVFEEGFNIHVALQEF